MSKDHDNEKNGQNKTNPERPWENSFDNDRDEDGKLSRVASKKRDRGNKVFVSILVVILLAVIGTTIWAWVSAQNSHNDNGTQIVVESKKSSKKSSSSKEKSSSKKSSSKKSSKKSSSSKESSSSESSSSSSEAVVESSSSSSSSSVVESSSSSSSSYSAPVSSSSSTYSSSSSSAASSSSTPSTSTASTYTIQAGDNLYRIAVNHGLTLDELLALNGLQPGSSIAPGQAIRVK